MVTGTARTVAALPMVARIRPTVATRRGRFDGRRLADGGDNARANGGTAAALTMPGRDGIGWQGGAASTVYQGGTAATADGFDDTRANGRGLDASTAGRYRPTVADGHGFDGGDDARADGRRNRRGFDGRRFDDTTAGRYRLPMPGRTVAASEPPTGAALMVATDGGTAANGGRFRPCGFDGCTVAALPMVATMPGRTVAASGLALRRRHGRGFDDTRANGGGDFRTADTVTGTADGFDVARADGFNWHGRRNGRGFQYQGGRSPLPANGCRFDGGDDATDGGDFRTADTVTGAGRFDGGKSFARIRRRVL